jgi:NAD(P)-dependent dehydrogenase (short-subunit alcohol dehydrogenase family)
LKSLNNKYILITGASSGIGRQTAIEASKFGANIILVARNKTKLEETKNSLVKGNHFICPFDLNNLHMIDALIDEITSKAGVISGFVHSAGIEYTVPLRNMNPQLYDELFKINVISALELARSISGKKRHHPSGASFVFIGSIMGKLGREGKIGYCASKAALTSSIKAMALELSSKKIRCNVIMPGVVQTEMVRKMFENLPESSVADIAKQHPLGLGSAEDVAYLALFLLSDRSRWITGSEMVVDGGYSAI